MTAEFHRGTSEVRLRVYYKNGLAHWVYWPKQQRTGIRSNHLPERTFVVLR
jgi:hypothetical protein